MRTSINEDQLRRAMERAAMNLKLVFGEGHVPGWGVVAREVNREYKAIESEDAIAADPLIVQCRDKECVAYELGYWAHPLRTHTNPDVIEAQEKRNANT